MTGKELGKFLYDNGVYDTYQFIQNTRKTITTACFCKDTILSLIKRMENEHKSWQENLFVVLNQQENPVKTISITPNGMPSYELSVCDVPITAPFLLDKLTKDFFQYVRNAFDCMAQAANTACLATKAKKINTVDFGQMKKVFTQQTYSQMFSSISAWFTTIANSDKFHYIEAFNNRTKHTCDVYLKMSMALLSDKNEISINPFLHREQYQNQDVASFLMAVYDFVSSCYVDFLSILKQEISKQAFVENRYHKICIFQQKLKDSPDSGFSMPYIVGTTDIANMPEAIQVLLLVERSDKIYAKNCPFDTIYIKGPNGDFDYIGKYITSDSFGDDTLVHYRTYSKVPHNSNDIPLCFQAMEDPKQKGIFYHANMFMDINTISDDDDFIKRTQLTF